MMHRHGMTRLWMMLCGLTLAIAALGIPAAQAQTDVRCFAETGYCIEGRIRAYWEQQGGLPVFGYPIGPQGRETVEDRTLTVQWFERDRLEIQADGTVTAGRLGARYLELTGRPWQSFPTPLGVAVGRCFHFEVTNHITCDPFLSYWEQNGGLERFGYPITPPFQETLAGSTSTVQYFERRRMEIHPELPGSPILLGLLGNEVYGRTLPPLRPE